MLSFLIGCKGVEKNIRLKETNLPIIVRLNKKYNFISRINFPNTIQLENKSTHPKSFLRIDYKYFPYTKGIGEDVYESENKILVKIRNNQKKTVSPLKTKELIVYSWYRLDSTTLTQQQFKPYIEKMLAEGKDTLHIGTVSEFKSKHKELFDKLTQNDSISIQFLEGKKLGERITVPVEW